MAHWYHLEPHACHSCGALLLLTSLLNLKMVKTIKIVDCIRITKIHVNMFCVAFEDERLAVLVGDQGNDLIAQLGQESAKSVPKSIG